MRAELYGRATVIAVAGLAFSSPDAHGGEWKGHLATLFDAQIACTNTDSRACEPFLAEAVAIADVLTEIARLDDKGTSVTVTFHSMDQQQCSLNWFRSLNGQSLLHSALGLPIGVQDAKEVYWSAALMRASRQLCHS